MIITEQARVDRLMDSLINEINLLREWFKRDYPECQLKIDLDVNTEPTRTGIVFTLKIQVKTNDKITDNQRIFQNKIIMTLKKFNDDYYINKFLHYFNTGFRKSISQVLNSSYREDSNR